MMASPRMTTDELQHLARLARIRLTGEELAHFAGDISSILAYVSAINAITAEDTTERPVVPAVHNVFRVDEVTNEPGTYSDAMIAAFPESEGRFLKVKKILDQHG